MKRFAEQLNKKSQTVKMTAAERRDLQSRVFSYMEYHPMPKTTQQKNAEAYIKSDRFVVFNFNTIYTRSFAGFFAVLMFIIVPIYAEKSIPGDALYPVKVNFNEEIRSSLSVSPYAKVEWETERLERRIAEARLLASEGKLTPEAEEEVVKAVEEHSDAAEASIAVIRESDSDDAAIAEIAFESALSVQAEVLEGTLAKEVPVADGDSSEGHSVAAIATMVSAKQKEAEEKHSGATPSYEKLMAKIETETTRAYELFDSVKTVASTDEVLDVERRLADIERSMNEAVQLHSADRESIAEGTVLPEISLLRAGLSSLTKLISFMTDIDVRENVTVEELVPVTLTDEELYALLVVAHQDIDARLEALAAAISIQTETVFTEKIIIGMDFAYSQASSSKAALVVEEYTKAQLAADEALTAIGDLENMIESAEKEENDVIEELKDESSTSTLEVVVAGQEVEDTSEDSEDTDEQVEPTEEI